MNSEVRFLKESEVRERLGVSRGTINNWKKRGLPHLKMGRCVRFNIEQVLAWISEKQSSANKVDHGKK